MNENAVKPSSISTPEEFSQLLIQPFHILNALSGT